MPSKWKGGVSYGLKSKLKNYVVSDRSCFFIAVDVDPMLTIVLRSQTYFGAVAMARACNLLKLCSSAELFYVQ